MTEKIAVVCHNLGGPDKAEHVRPFLQNLFADPAIIRLPFFIRRPLAWLIAKKRAPEAQHNYDYLGGGSPLLANTMRQIVALQHYLAEQAQMVQGRNLEWKVFCHMRYWHPMAAETAGKVKGWQPDRIIHIPLYPQYSTTTTASSLRVWRQMAKRKKLQVPEQVLCCYPWLDGFVRQAAKAIREAYDQAQDFGKPRVLLSAHGLPEKIVKDGDPYQWQCEETAKKIVAQLSIPDLDWRNCYQSRVGPLQWIGPATEDEIRLAGEEKRPLIIYPLAFVSEHLETLVELDIEYQELAREVGCPAYFRVSTVGDDQDFIQALGRQIMSLASQDAKACIRPQQFLETGEKPPRLCPAHYSGCPVRVLKDKKS